MNITVYMKNANVKYIDNCIGVLEFEERNELQFVSYLPGLPQPPVIHINKEEIEQIKVRC